MSFFAYRTIVSKTYKMHKMMTQTGIKSSLKLSQYSAGTVLCFTAPMKTRPARERGCTGKSIDTQKFPVWTYCFDRVPDYLKPLSATSIAKSHVNAQQLTELAYIN